MAIDFRSFVAPMVTPAQVPYINPFGSLMDVMESVRSDETTRRGQDLQAEAARAQDEIERRGLAQSASQFEQSVQAEKEARLFAAGEAVAKEEREAARKKAEAEAKAAADRQKRDDELFKEFAAARYDNDKPRAEVLANELRRRGFKAEGPEPKAEPTLTTAEGAPGIKAGKPTAKAPTRLGAIEVTAQPLVRAPEAPRRKGYQISDAEGNVVWEDDEESIRQTQEEKIQETFAPILGGARDEGELRAGMIGMGVAQGALGTRSLKEAIDMGVKAYDQERLREQKKKVPAKAGAGKAAPSLKEQRFERQLETQDRDYVYKNINAEAVQQKIAELRKVKADSAKALGLAKGKTGTEQRIALISAIQSAQSGVLSNQDVSWGKNAEGIIASLETMKNTLTKGGQLSKEQIAGLQALATTTDQVVDQEIEKRAQAARQRIAADPGLENSPKREQYAEHAYRVIKGGAADSGAAEKSRRSRELRQRLGVK